MAPPLLLLAHCTLGEEDVVDDFLHACALCDAAVRDSEPLMLHHTLHKTADGRYTWTEVYADEGALRGHLATPALAAWLARHSASITLHVYGSLSDDAKGAVRGTGYDAHFYDRVLGFTRLEVFPPPAADPGPVCAVI